MRGFGKGIGRICAVAAATTAAKMAAQVRAALRETPTVELRLDWLSSNAERARFLHWLGKNKPRGATFLATCRRREGGGRLSGDIAAELYWLMQAREAGCSWCGLEGDTLHRLPGRSVREYAVPPGVLLSLHDFRRPPALTHALDPPPHGEVDATKI